MTRLVVDGVDYLVDPTTIRVTRGSSRVEVEPVDSPRLSGRTRSRVGRVIESLLAERNLVVVHPRCGGWTRRRLAGALSRALARIGGGQACSPIGSAPVPLELSWTSPSCSPTVGQRYFSRAKGPSNDGGAQ